ncbi:unannotated protein [freshwater metagenome]|uniref:Unannotated protein n=1 Tax=freshwater metagenome TaxID=449393 RepID=A0A6J7IBA7_9ZZZZ
MNTSDVKQVQPEEAEPSPLLHLVAPIVAIGATMIVRKALNAGYRRATGSDAPGPRDPGVSIGRILLWSVVTAAAATAVEVAVFRITNRPTHTG